MSQSHWNICGKEVESPSLAVTHTVSASRGFPEELCTFYLGSKYFSEESHFSSTILIQIQRPRRC